MRWTAPWPALAALLSSINWTKTPPSDARTTIRSIVIVIGVVFVAMWALVGFSVATSRHAALQGASSEARNLMIAFREEIASILHEVEGETQLLEQRMRRDGNSFDLYTWGKDSALISPGTARAVIVNPDGMLRSATADAHPGPINLSDRDYFRVHLDGKFHGLYIGQPIVGRILGVPVLPISRRVDATDGTFLGVIVILISPDALTKLHKSIDLGANGTLTLAGLDNIIRARFSADSQDGTKGIGRSIAGGTRPRVIPEGGQGSFVRAGVIDGIPRVFTYGRVGSYPLIVTVGLDQDEELVGWRWDATMIIALTLGATLLLSALGAYLIRQTYRDARTMQEATHSAEHDSLTGLPNRMLLNDRFDYAIAWANRHKNKVALLFLDLDGFKHINDSLGHRTGDELLQSIAARLTACVRASDTVSRQGGDEFVVLLSDVHRSEDAAIVARKMLHRVAEPHPINRRDLHVTTSIGVSVYPDDGHNPETLIKNADAAMYKAKDNGRNCYRFFTPDMNIRAVARQSIEEALRTALGRHEFALHYQPKINLRTGGITGAEALLRWTHPTRGSVSPAEFIPIAEECGLIVPIGTWVLREACDQARAWVDAGLPTMTMAVNISALQFRDEDFLENLFATLRETGIDPRSLEVELTESALMKHAEAAAVILQTLREKGVQVAIDDFGTGYSSLSYLRTFPVDELKIDQSFVRRISTHAGDAPIVTAVLAMARSLQLRVVAEGVETAEELAFLQAHDCDEAQGYYFSRPVPADRFAELLRRGIPEAVALVSQRPTVSPALEAI
jgi:diguanylate cyclase (GGDEF)-like protein